MKRVLFLVAMTFAIPGAAHAAQLCERLSAGTVFHCSIKGSARQVTVCDLPDGDFLYVYGRPGKPELELRRTRNDLTYTPWNGIGRSFWASLRFDNEDYGYEVAFDAEKTGEAPVFGVLIIHGPGGDNSGEIARRECRAGTVETRLEEMEARFECRPPSRTEHGSARCKN